MTKAPLSEIKNNLSEFVHSCERDAKRLVVKTW